MAEFKQIDGRWAVVGNTYSVKDQLKELGCKWNPDAKYWYAPDDLVAEKVAVALGQNTIAEQFKTKRESLINEDENFEVPCPEGRSFFGYQRAGVAFAVRNNHVLIGDQMGVGKSAQAIGILNVKTDIKSALVICPASLKINWQREFSMWQTRDLSVGICDTKTGFPSTDVVIINYDIVGKFRQQIDLRAWDICIVDEAHYLKNPKTQRTTNIFGSKTSNGILAKKWVFLTGTPIVNRPIELWPLLTKLDPNGLGSNWGKYVYRYCGAYKDRFGMHVDGASNLEELQRKMRGKFMIRRLKEDVLKDLPPKLRQVIVLPPDGFEKFISNENSKLAETENERIRLLANAELAKLESDEAYRRAMHEVEDSMKREFEDLSKDRHDLAVAKVPYIIEHLKSLVDSEVNKTIVFAWHHDVVNAIAEAFPEGTTVTVTGATKLEDRQKAVDAFQNDPKVNIFVGTIKAAGVGITLTAASHVVFAELCWVPGDLSQAEDRCVLEGQLVLTPNGWRPIETISVGDEIISHTGKPRRVAKVFSKSNRKITAEIQLEGWPELLKVTHDHLILTDGGWLNAENIRPGFKVAMPVLADKETVASIPFSDTCRLPIEFEGPFGTQKNGRLHQAPENIELTEEALFTFGYYVGDGFCRTDGSKSGRFISMSGNPGKKASSMARVEQWFGNIGCNKFEKGNEREWRFFSGEWALWFAENFGRTCFEKSIPEWVFNCSIAQRQYFLDGMLASDGYFRKGRYEYITANKDLAAMAARLMLACGHKPCVTIGSTGQWIVAYSKNQDPYLNVEKINLRHGKKNETVYDLTVEEDHSFVVGTAVVHNCHRLGQTESVLVQHIVVDGSVDARLANTIIQKQEIIDRALDTPTDIIDYSFTISLPEERKKKDEPVVRDTLNVDNRLVSRGVSVNDIATQAVFLTREEINIVHYGLQLLAGMDTDHAFSLNGIGFNKVDTYIGHKLAEKDQLTSKEAVLGRLIVRKYWRQLPEELNEKLKEMA